MVEPEATTLLKMLHLQLENSFHIIIKLDMHTDTLIRKICKESIVCTMQHFSVNTANNNAHVKMC
jgi:hypothetical protein